jgi:energy-coupling factor transporter transmembrane protein EcfT
MARWLEYESRNTFLHKGLHPFSKMMAVLSIMAVTSLWWDPRYLVVLVIPLVLFVYISKIPLRWFRIVLLAVVTAIYPVSVTALGQTNPGIYKVLDPIWATTPLLVTDLPIAGRVGVTPGGIMWLAAVEIRTILMASYAFVFIYTTSMAQVTDTLLALKVPNPIVFVIAIVYRLIPDLSRVVENILSAQRLRGWKLMHWNPVKMIQRAVPLMNPLMRRVAIMVEQITLATQVRGFGAGKPTPTQEIRLKAIDYAVVVLAAALFIGAVVGLIIGNHGLI